jgi:cytidine deaminase
MNLIDNASEAMKKAYAPYSKFSVGCAVRGESGTVYQGCNVENASYGATICAERVAITQAIAQGEKTIVELAVITSSAEPCMPCGLCLQVIAEFAKPQLKISSSSADKKKVAELQLSDLLPHSFNKASLSP